MEIQIDTSLLNTNMNKSSLDEIVNSKLEEIDNFIAKQTNLNGSEEYISIKISAFAIQNCKNSKQLLVYGDIIATKQTIYDYRNGDYIISIIYEPILINKFISDFIKSKENKTTELFNFKFPTSMAIVYKPVNRNNIKHILMFFPSLIRIFFSIFRKVKFNKWENILVNAENYQEAIILSTILKTIGYSSITINTTSQTDLADGSELLKHFNKLNLNNLLDIDAGNHVQLFDNIVDTKGDLIVTDKKEIYNLLAKGSNIYLIDVSMENAQLDPHDLMALYKNSVSLNWVNSKEMIANCSCLGKICNFLDEMESKLACSDMFKDFCKSKLFSLKIYEESDVGKLTVDDLTCDKNFISLINVKNN
jgi:hypothetical protein